MASGDNGTPLSEPDPPSGESEDEVSGESGTTEGSSSSSSSSSSSDESYAADEGNGDESGASGDEDQWFQAIEGIEEKSTVKTVGVKFIDPKHIITGGPKSMISFSNCVFKSALITFDGEAMDFMFEGCRWENSLVKFTGQQVTHLFHSCEFLSTTMDSAGKFSLENITGGEEELSLIPETHFVFIGCKATNVTVVNEEQGEEVPVQGTKLLKSNENQILEFGGCEFTGDSMLLQLEDQIAALVVDADVEMEEV